MSLLEASRYTRLTPPLISSSVRTSLFETSRYRQLTAVRRLRRRTSAGGAAAGERSSERQASGRVAARTVVPDVDPAVVRAVPQPPALALGLVALVVARPAAVCPDRGQHRRLVPHARRLDAPGARGRHDLLGVAAATAAAAAAAAVAVPHPASTKAPAHSSPRDFAGRQLFVRGSGAALSGAALCEGRSSFSRSCSAGAGPRSCVVGPPPPSPPSYRGEGLVGERATLFKGAVVAKFAAPVAVSSSPARPCRLEPSSSRAAGRKSALARTSRRSGAPLFAWSPWRISFPLRARRRCR
eukprot:COSAG04_NODE_783_length_10324_cov_23.562641_3_plen_298_part_00